MSNYINQVSDSLKNHISELANNPCLFLRNPNVDFSRKRKIDFKTFIGIMMNSGGATMSKELLDFFDFNKNTPSVSAFTQQRSKVLPEAFEYLFKSFTDDNLPMKNNDKTKQVNFTIARLCSGCFSDRIVFVAVSQSITGICKLSIQSGLIIDNYKFF